MIKKPSAKTFSAQKGTTKSTKKASIKSGKPKMKMGGSKKGC